jgi:hypothetical protein
MIVNAIVSENRNVIFQVWLMFADRLLRLLLRNETEAISATR